MHVDFLGYGFGQAGTDGSTQSGPETVKNSEFIQDLNFQFIWKDIVESKQQSSTIEAMYDCYQRLKQSLNECTNEFCVFGGDHTSAVASVQAAKSKYDNLKIMWIDAHMDSHNHHSSISKNIHGMSLAILLGHIDSKLELFRQPELALSPSDVCIFGARSYEPEEKSLVDKLGVNVVYMDDINSIGIKDAWHKALTSLNLSNTDKLMFSIDMDAFDPKYAPAVTVPEPGGIDALEFCKVIADSKSLWKPNYVGCEIVEFSPVNDQNNKTEQLIIKILNTIFA